MKFQDDISMPHTHVHTHTHTDKPKPICPPLFQSWGHKKYKVLSCNIARIQITSFVVVVFICQLISIGNLQRISFFLNNIFFI